MLGDFILSFQRQEMSPDLEDIKDALTPDEEQELMERARQIITYHGGADENLLMTGLIPHLNHKNLLHRLAKFDFRAFFDAHFIRKGKMWHTEDQIDEQTHALKPTDFIQAEHVTEQLIQEYLKERHYAGIDELLNLVYTTLVNSHRPGIETIHRVLNRLTDSSTMPGQKRVVYYLKPAVKASQELSAENGAVIQTQLFAEDELVSTLEHNDIILRLAQYAKSQGYEVHAGETEQRKDSRLRNISTPMINSQEYGLPATTLETIKEIDLP